MSRLDLPMTLTRRRVLGVVAVGVAVLAIAAVGLWASHPRTAAQRLEVAKERLSGVAVTVTVASSSLVATDATADFGITEGIRLVRVRIVDELDLHVRLESSQNVALTEAPRVCIVGPFSAPDDAGLSDRCWGAPDLEEILATDFARDSQGHRVLAAGDPIDLRISVGRGDARCDYPPGDWHLEVALSPVIDGFAVGPTDLPNITFAVPLESGGPLPLLGIRETRFCGLASGVYRTQGEPEVLVP